MSLSREEQKKIARERLQNNYNERSSSGGFSGARAIDLSKIGGFRKNLFYRPKEGMNHIDILPYLIKTDHHPQKMKKGEPDYLLDIWIHRRVGSSESTYLCLQRTFGKACPICEERLELKKDPTADENYLKSLEPKRRCWYNVVNLDLPEREQEVQLFEESQYLFERELLEEAGSSGELQLFWDIEEGSTIAFRTTEEKSPQGKYFKYKSIKFEKRAPYKENVYQNTFALDDLLIVPTYEEVRNARESVEDDGTFDTTDTKDTKKEENVPETKKEGMSGLRGAREETAKDESPRRSSLRDEAPAKEEEKESTGKCPSGHKFGVDVEEFKECHKCDEDIWTACSREKRRLGNKG